MKESDKIEINDEIWTDINYQLGNYLLKEAFSNPNLNHKLENSEIVYHYVTLESFLSIVESQSLYFTNLYYLNDRKEYNHGVEIILDTLKHQAYNETSESKLKILNYIEKNLESNNKSSRYVACFSKNGDLLSQWRAYGNQGKGISIGFKKSNLEYFDGVSLNCMNIEYREEFQKKIINEIIKIIIAYFENIKVSIDWEGYNYELLVSKSIITFIEDFISNFKDPSFDEEKEFRLEYKIDGNINKNDNSKLLFRSNGSLIIPFYKIEYVNRNDKLSIESEYKKLPIEKIIIGPSLDYELNKNSIESFLLKFGYENIEIIQSKIPYRI
ncbi:DUF2971 domain-containing protein [Flavobacterium sp. Arc3]|uniref:DUF2971 domain-containing protein n=1 Tax=Flavobacterium sp. Arc3 TaxID=3046686 RepID=UPI00352E1AFD